MLKKLFMKLGRLALLFMAVSGQLAMILSTAAFAERSSFIFTYQVMPAIHATAWHLKHGSTVAFSGHIFHLPARWYPVPGSRPGTLDLRHTTFGYLDLDSVHLVTTPQPLDDRSLQEQFARTTEGLNRHSSVPDEWKVETLAGRKLIFRCTASHDQGTLLFCQPADSNLRLVAATSTNRARTDALSILETSE